MSVTVDTNILLYAANTDDDAHPAARDVLERLASGPDLLYLFWPTIMGFLRISTHPAVFPDPYAPDQATQAVTALLQRPNVAPPVSATGSGSSTAPPPAPPLVPTPSRMLTSPL